MEKVASQVSETAIQSQEKRDDEAKKIEFNVNAKEFIPVMFHDGPEKPEPWNVDQPVNQRTAINQKIGDNYKPMFMEGMTEKFIEGPYVGNGKDPEIPFVRYYSKGQAIDFFNKKYFCAEPSGEISFRNCGESGEQDDVSPPQQQQKPYYDSTYVQSNIFRPPFVDMLVQDILYWQYLAASRNKVIPRRPNGKPSFSRRKEETCRPEEFWEEPGTDQLQAQPSNEQQNDQPESIKEQRPVRAHRRLNFTNSNLSSNHNSKDYKSKCSQCSQNKPDDTLEKKNEVMANDFHEPREINADEFQEVKDPDESEVENDCLKSVENLSIAVNITIDSPTEDYSNAEKATGLTKSITDGEKRTRNAE